MRKIILLITLLLITGCSKNVICKSSGSNEDISITQEYKINYEDNNVTNISSKKTYKFEDEQQFENFENLMNYTVSMLKQDNVDASYKKKNKKYILTEKYSVQELDDEKIITLGLSKNLDELKQKMQENGLECK